MLEARGLRTAVGALGLLLRKKTLSPPSASSAKSARSSASSSELSPARCRTRHVHNRKRSKQVGGKRSYARGNHLTITTDHDQAAPPRTLAISHTMPHYKYNRLGLEICGSYSRLGSSSTRRGYPPDRHSSQQRTKSAAADIYLGWRVYGTGSSPCRASRRHHQ